MHPSSGVKFLTVSTATGTNHSIVSATYSQCGLVLTQSQTQFSDPLIRLIFPLFIILENCLLLVNLQINSIIEISVTAWNFKELSGWTTNRIWLRGRQKHLICYFKIMNHFLVQYFHNSSSAFSPMLTDFLNFYNCLAPTRCTSSTSPPLTPFSLFKVL